MHHCKLRPIAEILFFQSALVFVFFNAFGCDGNPAYFPIDPQYAEYCGESIDHDGDGFFASECSGDDCDDDNPAVYPYARENQDNGIDDNCNGQIDELRYPEDDTGLPPSMERDGFVRFSDCDPVEVHGRHEPFDELTFIPVVVHVVTRDDGTGGLTNQEVEESIGIANRYFDDLNVRFFIRRIQLLHDTNHYDVENVVERFEMYENFNELNVVNIYYVNSYAGFGGAATFPNSGLYGIHVTNRSATGRTTIAHELGHFFNLLHTHETFRGRELVDGSNCTEAGDFLCDTPADLEDVCEENIATCILNNCEVDANGDVYEPDIGNLMSYYHDRCNDDSFSVEQQQLMLCTMREFYAERIDIESHASCRNNQDCEQGELCHPSDNFCMNIEEFYLKASNAGADDHFGFSVSLDGNRMVVGAVNEDGDRNSTANNPNENAQNAGAVYVFELQADGVWQQTAYLKARNADDEDSFGISVAVDGDRLVVGAHHEDGDANSTLANPNDNADWAGAAYVFDRQPDGQWQQTAYLKASNAGWTGLFGRSVSFEGNRLVVGAPGEDGNAESTADNPNRGARDAGAAYVFERQPDGQWQQTAFLKASNAEVRDNFGWSVSLEGNQLVIGATGEDGNAESTVDNPNNEMENAGAVYVFELRNNAWQQTAYLKASNVGTDAFGKSVELYRDYIAVGAPLEDGDATSTADNPNNRQPNAGAVYIFEHQFNGRWEQTAYLKASNAGIDDQFGGSISLDGNRIVIGAAQEDGDARSTVDNPNDGARLSGAAYVFERQINGIWQETAYLKASNTDDLDRFGTLVAIHGSQLVVGARGEAGDIQSTSRMPNDNAPSAGAVYSYTLE